MRANTPCQQLVIHSSERSFFLPSPRSIPLGSHTWRLQNVRLDDVGSVHDRGRRRQIAQVVDRLLGKEWESSFILMPHLELHQGVHVVGWIPHVTFKLDNGQRVKFVIKSDHLMLQLLTFLKPTLSS